MKSNTEMKCKICSNSNIKTLFSVNNCMIAECTNCNFVQMIANDNIKYEYKESYFVNSKYNDEKAMLKELNRRKNLLIKYCQQGSTVLDVGCASGDFVNFIADEYVCEGFDISISAIEIAKLRFPKIADKIWQSDINGLQGINKSYNIICLWDVIEHVFNPIDVISDINDKLSVGGALLISTPNINSLFAKIMGKRWPFMTPPEHVSFFSKKVFSKIFEQYGMKVKYCKSKGKWVNVGFILYKINRVSKKKIPDKVLQIFKNTILAKLHIYVPTADILYIVAVKDSENQRKM